MLEGEQCSKWEVLSMKQERKYISAFIATNVWRRKEKNLQANKVLVLFVFFGLLKPSHVHRNTVIGNKNTNDEKKKVKKRDEAGKEGDLCEHLLEWLAISKPQYIYS